MSSQENQENNYDYHVFQILVVNDDLVNRHLQKLSSTYCNYL